MYIFDQRFPKSSLDSRARLHLQRFRGDLFEKIPFLENEEVVGEGAPELRPEGVQGSWRCNLQRRQMAPRESLTSLILDWMKANAVIVGDTQKS